MAYDVTKRNDDLFPDDFFGNFGRSFFNSFDSGNMLKTDISEDDKAYKVTVDIPGLDKKNIHVDYKDNVLSIEAKREDVSEEKNEQGKIIRRERHYGNFSRSFRIPNVKADDVKATYENGELKLTLPKLEKTNSTTKIEID